ncbi:velvet factor-domain-containing protein [Glomus cerebriforme]|uniref:Velvet factor-domain-containing protein n=2 Tax=Glomeraceae TaxID=36751 RepID=A0A397TC73_9GLOM|nr:velvet factor-domain-containing protein [Glomus cerebriforme]
MRIHRLQHPRVVIKIRHQHSQKQHLLYIKQDSKKSDSVHLIRQQEGRMKIKGNFSCRKYTLIVSQQPLRARMCGFGEKDRRPIDPPPIVQLVVTDEKGNPDTGANLRMLQNPFFVLHVTLWSEDGRDERNVISNPPKTTRVLMGSLVSSPAILKNTTGEQGCYFCFPDLSIRTEGKYTLKFSLMKLGTEDRLINTRTEIIATTYSDPFTVYSAKKFPGMTESTELSKAFAKQGLKIPIRNDVRPRKVAED